MTLRLRGLLPLLSLLLASCVPYPEHHQALSGEIGAVERQAPLHSVLVRQHDVLASNEYGVFRADRERKDWQRLALPEAMPLKGVFAEQPPNSSLILYYSPGSWGDWEAPQADGKINGLYVSSDHGRSWRLATCTHQLSHVFLHDNATVFAIETIRYRVPKRMPGYAGGIPWIAVDDQDRELYAIRDRALKSTDLGVSWQDITGDIGPGERLYGFLRDPDHPNLVCLRSNCIRSYVLQAENENYDWKSTRVWDWMETHQTEDEFFFLHPCSGGDGHQATLDNYFLDHFGSRTNICGFDVVPAKQEYTFAMGEPVVIDAEVRFLRASESVKIVDLANELHCWGLSVAEPGGVRRHLWPARYEPPQGVGRETATQRLRQGPHLRVYDLSKDCPYGRSIDLSQLYDFSRIGTYKLQLHYDPSWLADESNRQWIGRVSGQVFTVTITD